MYHQLAFQDFIGAAAERAVASADLNPYLNRHLADAGVGTGGGGGTARAIHLPLWSEVNGTLAGSAAAAAGNAAAGADGFVNAVGGSSGAGQGGASNHISPSHPLLMGRSQANGNTSRCDHQSLNTILSNFSNFTVKQSMGEPMGGSQGHHYK